MKTSQDSPYTIRDGRIIDRATGEAIPDDEPIFILRAKDRRALTALIAYYAAHQPGRAKAIEARIEEFKAFARAHPQRMQEPDAEA